MSDGPTNVLFSWISSDANSGALLNGGHDASSACARAPAARRLRRRRVAGEPPRLPARRRVRRARQDDRRRRRHPDDLVPRGDRADAGARRRSRPPIPSGCPPGRRAGCSWGSCGPPAAAACCAVFDLTPGLQTIVNPPIDLGADAPSPQTRAFQSSWGGLSIAESSALDVPVVTCTTKCVSRCRRRSPRCR